MQQSLFIGHHYYYATSQTICSPGQAASLRPCSPGLPRMFEWVGFLSSRHDVFVLDGYCSSPLIFWLVMCVAYAWVLLLIHSTVHVMLCVDPYYFLKGLLTLFT